MATIISPSLLSADLLNLKSELNSLATVPDLWLHLDIMDGHFVENLTFGYPLISLIAESGLYCDCHLMVNNPEFHVRQYRTLPLGNITFHLETTKSPLNLIELIKNDFPSSGVTLRPSTPLDLLSDDILKKVDLVLVMTVDPGRSGQTFIESMKERVTLLEEKREALNATFQIQVDGGVNASNAAELIKLGADNLVSGNFYFKTAKEVGHKKAADQLRSK